MHPNSHSTSLGYLSVYEDPAAGLYGGLLLLNIHGRPLELHCSVPVRINRAQALLYGDSLRPQLFGHTIGPALLEAAGVYPCLILTDCLDMLSLRRATDIPLAYVQPPLVAGPTGPRGVLAEEGQEIAGCRGMAAPGYRDDVLEIRRLWEELSATVELLEPFQRLREALREMMGIGPTSASQAA